jgi:cytidylate kinase
VTGPKAIAIDGPVASGKTAVGRLVAQRLGIRYLDTGAMYRAVTWTALRRGTDLEDEAALARVARGLTWRLAPAMAGAGRGQMSRERLLVDGQEMTDALVDPEVERGVSLVAKAPGVRVPLVEQQRAIAREGPIVMVGRDIGTVVLPRAAIKIYLQASVEVRTRRRYLELERRGEAVDYAQVLRETTRRDRIDSERAESPLRPADDAILIDTADFGVEELVQQVLGYVERD